jgi:hypothetical protein
MQISTTDSYRGLQVGWGVYTVVIRLAIVLVYTDSHNTMVNLVTLCKLSFGSLNQPGNLCIGDISTLHMDNQLAKHCTAVCKMEKKIFWSGILSEQWWPHLYTLVRLPRWCGQLYSESTPLQNFAHNLGGHCYSTVLCKLVVHVQNGTDKNH